MTFKNKLSCSTLTDDQHRRIIQHVEYCLYTCYDEDELLREYHWLIEFISSLESMSVICPREREKYLVFIKERYENRLEEIEERS